MNAGVELLFDEFAARHARGEHPDAREYLERAGESRDDLARLLDGFLAAAPMQPSGAETLALFASLVPEEDATPPLLAERVRQGWRRDEIVDWIRERFGIGEEKREKVAGYWHELETGLLPLSRVSARLREALSERFGEAIPAALSAEPRKVQGEVVFLRAASASWLGEAEPTAPAASAAPEPERDEVDELFGSHS